MITTFTSTGVETSYKFDNGYSVYVIDSKAHFPGYCAVEIRYNSESVIESPIGVGFYPNVSTDTAEHMVEMVKQA